MAKDPSTEVDASFCDGSIPPSKAASVRRWASELTHHPSPDKLHEYLKLQITDQLGMHMIARRAFAPGELVLSENALIRLPSMPKATSEKLDRRYGQKASFLSPAVAPDWTKVNSDAQKAALELFWAHPLMTRTNSRMVEEHYDVCKDFIQWHEPLRDRWEVMDLIRYLHVVDLNIHKDEERHGNADFTGIFVLGSKFTHSCAPNSSWGFGGPGGGCLQYRAIRNIEPGDLLTFSYIGNGMNLLMSTFDRRQRLASLWFSCCCSRCSAPDYSRTMKCPKCGVPDCIPKYPELDSSAWKGDRPLSDLILDASSWACGSCGQASSSADMPLKAEDEFSQLVPQAMKWPMEEMGRDAEATDELRSKAFQTVGPMHWTWMLATFAWLQKWLVRLSVNGLVYGHDKKRLQAASVAVKRWFDACASENTEQSLAAVFLAARLADNLGCYIQALGYNPKEVLVSDGRTASDRFMQEGWFVDEEDVEKYKENKEASMANETEKPMIQQHRLQPYRAIGWHP